MLASSMGLGMKLVPSKAGLVCENGVWRVSGTGCERLMGCRMVCTGLLLLRIQRSNATFFMYMEKNMRHILDAQKRHFGSSRLYCSDTQLHHSQQNPP